MLYDASALIFLSTLSLRRATYDTYAKVLRVNISIHALLAESDAKILANTMLHFDFYPRSPCGERRINRNIANSERKFLSTLSLRRATIMQNVIFMPGKFLSTLSLRRATGLDGRFKL